MGKRLITLASVVILVLAMVWFIRSMRHKQVPGYAEIIRDSIKITKAKIKISEDSTIYWQGQHNNYVAKNDSVNRLDSAGRAALRASLRARVRAAVGEEIRTGLAR